MQTSKFVLACKGQNTSSPPIWLMRQAGRYMASYQKLRQKYSFMQLCKKPELAFEVTMQPLNAFGFDAGIVFSDILLVAEELGIPLEFSDGKGPVFEFALRSERHVQNLQPQGIGERLSYVYEAIKLLKQELSPRNIPLLGFCGAPFTVASYMIEGQSSMSLRHAKQFLFSEPQLAHQLLDMLTEASAEHLLGQVQAGADALQIFDTWTNHLTEEDFETFALSYVRKLIAKVKQQSDVPIILFCKHSKLYLEKLAQSGADILSLDWTCNLAEARKTLGPNIGLQGNIDPCLLFAPQEELKKRTNAILHSMKDDPRFIFNLGHGVLPQTPEDNVKLLTNLVQGFNLE